MLFVDVPRFERQHRTVSSAAVPTHERGTAYEVWWKNNESDVPDWYDGRAVIGASACIGESILSALSLHDRVEEIGGIIPRY